MSWNTNTGLSFRFVKIQSLKHLLFFRSSNIYFICSPGWPQIHDSPAPSTSLLLTLCGGVTTSVSISDIEAVTSFYSIYTCNFMFIFLQYLLSFFCGVPWAHFETAYRNPRWAHALYSKNDFALSSLNLCSIDIVGVSVCLFCECWGLKLELLFVIFSFEASISQNKTHYSCTYLPLTGLGS